MKKVIAMTLALVLCLSIMSAVAFAAPEGLSRLAVVGSGIPGVSEWNITDPAGDMTEISESVYEKTLTLTAGTEIRFKVATDDSRGGWNDAFNFGSAVLTLGTVAEMDNGSGTGDMFFKADKDITIVITVDVNPLKEGGKATILIDEDGEPKPTEKPTEKPTDPTVPEEEESTDTVEKRALTVVVPPDWTTVYIYAWDDRDYSLQPFGEYPGSVMSNRTDNTYELEIDVSIHNLVFSNQKGNKTDDLNIYSDRDVKIVIASNCMAKIMYSGATVRPLPIEPVGELSEYRVVGNADWLGKWDPAFEGGRMIKMPDGIYRKNFENVEPGSYELKITKDGKWGNAYGVNGQNFTFTVSRKCNVTVDFKLNGNVGIIEVYGQGCLWDEDEEENPKSDDQSLTWLFALLLSGTVALPLLLRKKKEML